MSRDKLIIRWTAIGTLGRRSSIINNGGQFLAEINNEPLGEFDSLDAAIAAVSLEDGSFPATESEWLEDPVEHGSLEQ